MSDPEVRFVELPRGRFRALDWAGSEPAAVFLHGLTGVAEVWGPTMRRLTDGRRCIAYDQRGHGQSAKPREGYEVSSFVQDLLEVLEALELHRPHLVGHSMGGRVAMVAAAHHRKRFRTVAIVDIGPEAWRDNWVQTVEGLERMPERFPSLAGALGGGSHDRGGDSLDASLGGELQEMAAARLKTNADGTLSWWSDRDALEQTVRLHRSRSYWRDWRALQPPALFVGGGTSREVRPAIAQRMRRENPSVICQELEGVGHNIPLLAPDRLAATLSGFWSA